MMGQLLTRQLWHEETNLKRAVDEKFPDLSSLPPEISIQILSKLNATDLCWASCVNNLWKQLANDEIIWERLCRSTWRGLSVYGHWRRLGSSFHDLYMILDEGSLMFNTHPARGIDYLVEKGAIKNTAQSIAELLHSTKALNRQNIRVFLESRSDVMNHLIGLQNYKQQFLPNALRQLFQQIEAPEERGMFLQQIIQHFSQRYCTCNPDCQMDCDTVFVLCYSLILLSVDLTSPHVKNKMSKREFIRNIRGATNQRDDELFGHLYDNIYLIGHIAR